MTRFAGMRRSTFGTSGSTCKDLLDRFPSRTIREQTRAQLEKASRGLGEHNFPDLIDQASETAADPRQSAADLSSAPCRGVRTGRASATGVPRISADASRRAARAAGSLPSGRPRRKSGGRGERGDAVRHFAVGGLARTIRSFCRSRKPGLRCWSLMRASRFIARRRASGRRPAVDSGGQRSVFGLDARPRRPAFLCPSDAQREGAADGRNLSAPRR